MQKTLFIALITATGLLTGCQNPYYNTRTAQTRQTSDQMIAQEQQRQLSGRIESIEMEISRIGSELDTLQRNIDSRCSAIELKSENDKREMVNRLSEQLEQLLIKNAPAAAPASAPSYGTEHVVRPGETLSTIATAYGASIKKVIEVNKLKNPNHLSVGQKLFIPD